MKFSETSHTAVGSPNYLIMGKRLVHQKSLEIAPYVNVNSYDQLLSEEGRGGGQFIIQQHFMKYYCAKDSQYMFAILSYISDRIDFRRN